MKKNNELVKKGLAIILALVLTVSLVPDSVIPVNAATGKVKLNKKISYSIGRKKKTIILKKSKAQSSMENCIWQEECFN